MEPEEMEPEEGVSFTDEHFDQSLVGYEGVGFWPR